MMCKDLSYLINLLFFSLTDEVISLREGSINIHDMVSLYAVEDEAQAKVDLAEAILYNFDRQPFLDMRWSLFYLESAYCTRFNLHLYSLRFEAVSASP